MDVRDLSGKTALVTGAASGIGRATALEIAGRGADLVICDVNESGLAETEQTIRAGGRKVLSLRVDVSRSEEMREFAKAVHQQLEAVDLLVNNAGVALAGGFLDTRPEDWDWILGVNLRGVIDGCHHFIPPMVKRGRGGHVVIVSSGAGYSASAALAAYCTSKFAVLGLAECLAEELQRHHIGVTAICPGLIDTPITGSAKLRGIYTTPGYRERMVEGYRWRAYPPERVARNILKAVQRNRVVAPVSPEAWLIYYLKRFAPGLLRWFSLRLSERLRKQATG